MTDSDKTPATRVDLDAIRAGLDVLENSDAYYVEDAVTTANVRALVAEVESLRAAVARVQALAARLHGEGATYVAGFITEALAAPERKDDHA